MSANRFAVHDDLLVRDATLDVPAGRRRHVHDHAPGRHARHHVRVDDAGGGPPEQLRGRDHHVRAGHDRRHLPALLRQLLRRQFLGVPLLRLAGLADVELHELRAQRLHLLRDDGAGVVRLDAGPEALRRRDRLQARDADAYPPRLAWLDNASIFCA
jgi:hypothetical protein